MTKKEAIEVMVLSIAIGATVLSIFAMLGDIFHSPLMNVIGFYYAMKYSFITSEGVTWVFSQTEPETFRQKTLRILATWP